MGKQAGAQWDWTALRSWGAPVLAMAALTADALVAPTLSSILFTAAVVAYVYSGSQRYVPATTIRLLLAVSLAVGVTVFAASGGSWSAAANAVSVITVVPAVWLFALSVRDGWRQAAG